MKRLGMFSLVTVSVLGFGGLASATPDPAASVLRGRPAPSGAHPGPFGAHPAPSGSMGVRSSQAEMAEIFRKHRPNQEELKAAMSAAQANAKGRREARLLEMRHRYAAATLANREVFTELRIHAKRMAFLNRAKVVATTELDEPKRSKVIARVEKLTLTEQARHQRRMETLRADGPGVAPSAARFPASPEVPGGPPRPDASGGAKPPKPHGPPLTPPGLSRGPAAKGSAP
jgi:hypothetical protein